MAKAGLAHFVVDARGSRFTVQAFATGVLSAMGHNPTIGIPSLSGEVDFAPDPPSASGLHLAVQSASLSAIDDIPDRDRREIERLMKDQVLEVSRYPEIKYEAASISISRLDTSLFSATLNGTLSLHGIARIQPVQARVAFLGEMLRASGEFTVKQSDYQIKPVSVAGGALKVKDELKLSFEIIARSQG